MDHKKSPIRRGGKRQSSKGVEENFWDCSVCTFSNSAEAFKCLMCDVRKGTSTRKPRLNSALVAQQAATLPGASSSGTVTTNGTTAPSPISNNHHSHHHHHRPPGSNSSSSSTTSSKYNNSKHKHKKFARLKNVDRSSAQTREVTVNSVTVVITEYKPKPVVNRRESSDQSFSESNDSRS